MAGEFEAPLEPLHEKIEELHEEHVAQSASAGKHTDWTHYIAVVTAVLAVIAAISSLQANLLINEALLKKNDQTGQLARASDQWNYYQAKGIKGLIAETAAAMTTDAGVRARYGAESARYTSEQIGIKAAAEKLERNAAYDSKEADHLEKRHYPLAFAAGLSEIAIALSAMASIRRNKHIWALGLVAGIFGLALLIYGFAMP